MPSPSSFKPRELIRWGIVGCGDVTEVKSGPGFQKAEGSRLVSVMRRDAAKAADYAKRHGVPKWTADADALIHDPEVDAVYIATPPSTHCEYALRVCAAGKPCYVEKPMARNVPECERMVKSFADARLPLFVAFYRRRLPRFLRAKALIKEGALGHLTEVRYHYAGPHHQPKTDEKRPWRWVAADTGGGVILDIGSHTLDILDFMVGRLVDVLGAATNVMANRDVEDVVTMTFRTDSGVPGLASWNSSSAVEEDMFTISGTKGRLSLSTLGFEPVRLETRDGVTELDFPKPDHVAQGLIQSIVDELRGRGTCPSTGVSALRTAKVTDQVLESYYGGRDDAYWLRPETWPGRRK